MAQLVLLSASTSPKDYCYCDSKVFSIIQNQRITNHHQSIFACSQHQNQRKTKLHHFNLKSLIKLIFMQALASIPKVLSRVEDIRSEKNIEQAFEEYKKNVRIFVENMKKEVSTLIDNYEKTIRELRSQNQRLKDSLPSKQFARTPPSAFYSTQNNTPSPSRKNQQVGSLLDNIKTAKSNIFASARDRSLEELRLSPIFQKINEDHSQINPENQPYEKQASRFEIKNKRKRHREQQLRYFLESGNKNMNYTTQRFIQAIRGNNKKQNHQQEVNVINNHEQKQYSQDSESGLNKSLGNICNSLDTSYISKRARSENKKRKGQIQNQIQMKKKQDAIASEMLKKRGIKSLLQRLRENVDSSPSAKVQAITGSRFFSSHNKEEPSSQTSFANLKKSSKVMINPVPIDIQKKSKVTRKDKSTASSPLQKPQSILKQSAVLTRSISGISAIEFDL